MADLPQQSSIATEVRSPNAILAGNPKQEDEKDNGDGHNKDILGYVLQDVLPVHCTDDDTVGRYRSILHSLKG